MFEEEGGHVDLPDSVKFPRRLDPSAQAGTMNVGYLQTQSFVQGKRKWMAGFIDG